MAETYTSDLFQDAADNLERYLEELCEFLRIPGISACPDSGQAMAESCRWFLEKLERMGFSGQLCQTEGWPVVLARYEYGPSAPTLVIYGHYDVQSPEPLEKWITPPFEPTVRDGALYARGVNDDKGQVYTYLAALESYRRCRGDIPLNITFVVEGEEEVGSKALLKLLRERPEWFRGDMFLVSDSSMFSRELPAVTCGFRGIMAMQIQLQTMKQDLHSGLFGGIVRNAPEVLVQLLAKCKDEEGRVLIPGFYDQVRPLSQRERDTLARLPQDEEKLAERIGAPRLYGETGYTAAERKCARPTLDINGIWGGYLGEGSKTVIPCVASAKLSARLVPDQRPEEIYAKFEAFIRSQLPPDVQVTMEYQFGAMPVLIDDSDPNVQLAAHAIEMGFGREPVLIRSGGTVHIISEIKERLGIPSILILGWGRPENGSHAPNEHFYVEDFEKAVKSLCALFAQLAEPRPNEEGSAL